MRIRIFYIFFVLLMFSSVAMNSYSIERFPPPQFEGDYVRPEHTAPMPRGGAWPLVDAAVLLLALGTASWLIHKKRSRKAVFGLMVFSLAYFGFYRKGCVCSIGAIQDMSLFLFNADYTVPLLTIFFFIAPLIFTLLFGQKFLCRGMPPWCGSGYYADKACKGSGLAGTLPAVSCICLSGACRLACCNGEFLCYMQV